MKTFTIYCGGNFIETPQILEVKNKYNNLVFARTFLAGKDELESAIVAAQKTKEQAATLSSLEKYHALMQISEAILARRNELSLLLAEESAKPLKFALAEIDRAAQTFLIAAEESKRLPKEYISLDWTPAGKNREGIIKHFPAGIVAGISPFNFPMNLAVHKIAPAIAAGCPIILKPASSTPLSTLALAEIIDQTDLPKGMISILPMDRATGTQLVTDTRIHVLSFTGSPEVGWDMKRNCGRKKTVLELGGNAGVIITPSAHLTQIIDKCISGAFAYSGQICIHAQRFVVHQSHYEKFVNEMRAAQEKLKYGDPLSIDTDISNMIDEENAIRVEKWVKEALQNGAQLIAGGQRKGSYFEPTILTNVGPGQKVYDEEVFGPVICIETYDGPVSQAVARINDSKYGLQCGVFTDSVKELDEVFNTCEAGGIIHNDVPTLRFDQMPYGGIKESGLGREGIRYAIHDMMDIRILVK